MLDAHHSLTHQHSLLLVAQSLEKRGTVIQAGARPTPICLTLLPEPQSLGYGPLWLHFLCLLLAKAAEKGSKLSCYDHGDCFTFKKPVLSPFF